MEQDQATAHTRKGTGVRVCMVAYTFYDTAGNALAGTIAVDNSRDFAAFFAGSNAGGNFLLRAVFPVSGDASRIAAFEAQMTNSAGTATTGRVRF